MGVLITKINGVVATDTPEDYSQVRTTENPNGIHRIDPSVIEVLLQGCGIPQAVRELFLSLLLGPFGGRFVGLRL